MDNIRKRHNSHKRNLITHWVKPHAVVLDCGCGRGGDFHKWKLVNARVVAIDPDNESLCEAQRRAVEIGLPVWFLGEGDIRQAAFAGPYDVVCYNFSLQYIVNSWEHSIQAIKCSVKKGGHLIGIVPEKSLFQRASSPDNLGNTFQVLGDTVLVHLVDGPFYADGPKEEPLLDGERFRQALEPEFTCLEWTPLVPVPSGYITDVYAQFVFLRM